MFSVCFPFRFHLALCAWPVATIAVCQVPRIRKIKIAAKETKVVAASSAKGNDSKAIVYCARGIYFFFVSVLFSVEWHAVAMFLSHIITFELLSLHEPSSMVNSLSPLFCLTVPSSWNALITISPSAHTHTTHVRRGRENNGSGSPHE